MTKEELKEKTQDNNDCFVIMPIADREGYDKGHFKKVYEDLFKVACENSGFNAIRADDVQQTNLIHLDILQKLIDSPMAICDLSSRNPNVLFELGLRQAFDKPTVLVQECDTPKIFDIAPLRYTEYRKELKYREVLEDQESIAEALIATKNATDKGEGINSIIKLLSLSSPASLKEVTENDSAQMLQIVMSEMNELRNDVKGIVKRKDNINKNKLLNNQFELVKIGEELDYIFKSIKKGKRYNLLQEDLIFFESKINSIRERTISPSVTHKAHLLLDKIETLKSYYFEKKGINDTSS